MEAARTVKADALVMQRESGRISHETGRAIAAQIPNARFLLAPGSGAGLWTEDDRGQTIQAIIGFVAERPESAFDKHGPSGLQTILFTDRESSTALTQRLGDEGAQELPRGHNEAVRSALAAHDGREVKHTGDGIMASFPSAVCAVEASLVIQREMAGGEVRVRIGLNAGEPIAEEDDRFGLSVIKASRIGDRADAGQVLVSDIVRQLCEGKQFTFEPIGEVLLKGFDEPVALFEVRAG